MDKTSTSFPPETYTTSFSFRHEIKEFLLKKGLNSFKNGMCNGHQSQVKGKDSWRPSCCSGNNEKQSKINQYKPAYINNDDNSLLKFLALNALELTVAVGSGDAVLRSTSGSQTSIPSTPWFQLTGHPDSLAPAGPGTVWKRQNVDSEESSVYKHLATEISLRGVTPAFFREVTYRGSKFIELQDLLHGFRDPNVMDIKLGTRTFLETEVDNLTARHDLYNKMVAVDPNAPTDDENIAKAVTKMRYMQFREQQSSTCSLGFRIEAMKFRGAPPVTDLKRVKSNEQVLSTLLLFLDKARDDIRLRLLTRLEEIRQKLEGSSYLTRHEIIGSSILIIYDDTKVGAWLIDLAKTREVPDDIQLDHRSPWQPGNHEEGFLFGLDNLILTVGNLKLSNSDPNQAVSPTNKKTITLKSS